jgi:hypothetical protein
VGNDLDCCLGTGVAQGFGPAREKVVVSRWKSARWDLNRRGGEYAGVVLARCDFYLDKDANADICIDTRSKEKQQPIAVIILLSELCMSLTFLKISVVAYKLK